jgi:hypothetical protein
MTLQSREPKPITSTAKALVLIEDDRWTNSNCITIARNTAQIYALKRNGASRNTGNEDRWPNASVVGLNYQLIIGRKFI